MLLSKSKEENLEIEFRKKAEELKDKIEFERYLTTQVNKYKLEIEKKKFSIYEEIKNFKIENGSIKVLNGTEIHLFKPKKTLLNLYGLLSIFSKISKFKVLTIYLDKNELSFIGIKEKFTQVLKSFKNESYTIKEESKPFFHKGKRIIWLTPKSHINLQLEIKQEKLLCDSETANRLINYVFDWKLTQPIKAGGIGGLFDLIAKNWIIIAVAVIGYFLYASGSLNNILGI